MPLDYTGFTPGMKVGLILENNTVCHLNRLKKDNLIISTDSEKVLDKI